MSATAAAGTIGWYDLMTNGPEAAYSFYGRLFVWSLEAGPPESGGYVMCMSAGRPAAGIGVIPPGAPQPPAWTVYFLSDDVDATAARIVDAGGKVMVGPMDVMQEGRMVIASDVAGAVFGVWQAKRHRGAEARDEHGGMCWSEVNTRDAAAACAFYGKVFDLEAKPLGAPGMTYFTLHRGATTVGGVLQMDAHWPADVPAHWMPYFQVSDVDQACGDIPDLGGKVCVPPFDTPYGRIAVINDPAGAAFSIMTPPPPPPEAGKK